MSRPESDVMRRRRFVELLGLVTLLADPADREAIRAELTPGERAGGSSAEPAGRVQVYPATTMGVVKDLSAVLDWAEQHTGDDRPHPLTGAYLDPSVARLYAPLNPDGLGFYNRGGHVRIKDLSAAYAIEGRRNR